MSFKVGDKVEQFIRGKSVGIGWVERVGATCLYCEDENGNRFHSHTENFRLVGDPTVPQGLFWSTAISGAVSAVKREQKDLRAALESYSSKKVIVGLAGRKGSGKDTAALCLLERGFMLVKFAGPLKDMCRAFLYATGMDANKAERYVEGEDKETPLDVLCGRSMRYFMQTLGTEFGRNLIGDTLWVDAFKRRASMSDRVVCTDVRFPNEVEAVRSIGGKVLRIVREGYNPDPHPSEALIDQLDVDAEVVNHGSIKFLHAQVLEAVGLTD